MNPVSSSHSPASFSTNTRSLEKRRAPSTAPLSPRRDPADSREQVSKHSLTLATAARTPSTGGRAPAFPPWPRTGLQQKATRSGQRHLGYLQGLQSI